MEKRRVIFKHMNWTDLTPEQKLIISIRIGEITPKYLIEQIKPDILIKGGDYKKEDVVGYGFVKSYGGKVVIIPLYKKFSSSKIKI